MSNKESKEFQKYATKHAGISSLTLHNFNKNMTSNMAAPTSMTPCIVEERQMNVAVMSVFDRLMLDRVVWLCSGVEDYVSTVIQAQLMYLDSVDTKDISLHIDSPGGSVVAGLKIIDIMDYIKSDVCTINTGMAASMGAVILAAGKKGKRSSLKHSKTMIHMSSGGAVGNIQDARIMMAEWEKYDSELFSLLSEYTGKTVKQIIQESQRDKWMTSKEAESYGFIDSIVTSKKRKK